MIITKTCIRCGETKPIDSFSRDKNKSDGRRHYCRACDGAIRIQNGKKKRPARRDLLNELREQPCAACFLIEPAVMDLHHLDEPLKTSQGRRINFSTLINGTYSEATFISELMKCVTLCANCHRRVHAGTIPVPSVRLDESLLRQRLHEIEREYEPETREGQKFCSSCKTWKDVVHFSKDSTKKSGLQAWCKTCKHT